MAGLVRIAAASSNVKVPFLLSTQRACFRQAASFLSSAPSDLTLCEQKDGIRTITLNDPPKRNALSLAMLDSLKSDLLRESDSVDLRVIVLKSQGPVFSAGHDLKELTSESGIDYHRQVFDRCTEVMSLVQDLPVPVIAQVNGLATAAGCQLVASCDMAVATDKSKFATPGVSIGLFCSTPAVALARAVPRKVAMEMLFTGHPIDAEAALQHGLVSKVVPEEQLEDETMKLAKRICETSRPVVALGKSTFYKQVVTSRDMAYHKQIGKLECGITGQDKCIEQLESKLEQQKVPATSAPVTTEVTGTKADRKKNLVIRNLTEDMEDTSVITRLINELDIPFAPYMISSCQRLGRKMPERTRPVLVRFRDRAMRDRVYAARSILRERPTFVSIGQDIGPETALLARKARERVRKGIIYRTWTANDNVYIIKNPGEDSISVMSEDQLPPMTTAATRYPIAGQTMVDNLRLRDGQEGIDAFINKRHPKWSHADEEVH